MLIVSSTTAKPDKLGLAGFSENLTYQSDLNDQSEAKRMSLAI
jgi:hypothetical protein